MSDSTANPKLTVYQALKQRCEWPEGVPNVVNIFPGGWWRAVAFGRIVLMFFPSWILPFYGAIFPGLGVLIIIVIYLLVCWIARHFFKRLIRSPMWYIRYFTGKLLLRQNDFVSGYWWAVYYMSTTQNDFEEDFRDAWNTKLAQSGNSVGFLQIFMKNEHLSIPICFSGTDKETFEVLRMWYCYMKAKGGFGKILLPKTLVRADKVEFSNNGGVPILGSRVETYDLGRVGASYVANFEDLSRLADDEQKETQKMVADVENFGLEFVQRWDSASISTISLVPFVFSLIFAAAWIGVSIGKYENDAQVAVQTAFTVAGYIVTAGAFIVALFAFLDGQEPSTWRLPEQGSGAEKRFSHPPEQTSPPPGQLHPPPEQSPLPDEQFIPPR